MTRLLTSKYISVGVTYISWFSDFALYLEYYLLDKCHTWDISSMWPNEWPLTISRSLWPIFHASVLLPFIFITISWRIVIPGLLYLCDKMIYIQIHLGQCDLYYMVEWFRHITWKLLHRNMSYPFDLIILGHCDLYFMVHWFSVIKEDSVMQKYHTWIIISFWPEDCPQYSSVWPIFHGSQNIAKH